MQLHEGAHEASPDKDESTACASLEAPVDVLETNALDHSSSSSQPWQPKGTTVTSLELADKDLEKCTVDGCKHKRAFSSAYELTRHVQTVHGGESAKRFVCSARGCFNGRLHWSFTRSDKLTSHIKSTHNYSTIFNTCPVATCAFGPCTLEALGVHIQHAHETLDEGRAVLNATPCKTRKCPLWRCGKHLVANQLMAHVQSHSSEDLEAAKSILETEGFLIEGTTQSGISVYVVCPVCRAVTADAIQFIRHLATDHLQTSASGGHVHFEKWKAYWRWKIVQSDAAKIQKLLPWARINHFWTLSRMSDYECPCCPFSISNVGGNYKIHDRQDQRDKRALIQEHHLSFLRPEAEVIAELYPHRMAILRLWSEFVTHPVFADFDQLQQQSTSIIPEM